MQFSFGVLVSDFQRLDMCLRQSAIKGSMHFLQGETSATVGLNKLLATMETEGADVAVLTHQDMSYRQGWLDQVEEQLSLIPDSWLVAGIIGKDMRGRICGKFHDMRIAPVFNTSDIHQFPESASCFDECCILVHLNRGFRFDEALDGWDLYGTLAVLQSWEMGETAYIIDAFAEHHCMRPFSWVPDEQFCRNFKWLHDRFPRAERIDSTAIGLPEGMDEAAA